jgi:Fur family transcriptional regulator, peroxide stress response regulator
MSDRLQAKQDRMDKIVTRFKDLGYRITPQRIAVVEILIQDANHPTVEQVYKKVKNDFPMTSRATVYKTIGLLKDMGEIGELNISNSSSHYDGYNPVRHPHLVCNSCSEIIDLADDLFWQMPIDAVQQHGYILQGHHATIYGICPKCQESYKS